MSEWNIHTQRLVIGMTAIGLIGGGAILANWITENWWDNCLARILGIAIIIIVVVAMMYLFGALLLAGVAE